MSEFPDVVRFEPTGACNLRCVHCPTGIKPNWRKQMAMRDFMRYFDALPIVPRVIVFYHGGEPLLNPYLPDMIFHAKSNGVEKTVINTNGMLLNISRSIALHDAGLDEMRVSIDGASADENNAIRVGADFETVANNIHNFLTINDKTKVIIYNVRYQSDGMTPAFLAEKFLGYPVEFRNEKIRTWAGIGGNHQAQFDALRPDFCSNLFETFTIMSDGRVVQCCEDITGGYIVGDLNHNSPAELWEMMSAIRRRFAMREYSDLCKSCHIVTGVYV